MPKRYDYRFTVQGRGPFPLDMLRRDQCFPRGENDANIAQRADFETRRVEIVAHDRPSGWYPTWKRWESFGWEVDDDTIEAEPRA